MKNVIIIFLFVITAALFSCEKVIIGDEPSNDPENNFELLWQDFDKHYALFNVKNIDWDALYAEYRPQVNQTTTDEELWDILTEMLEHLNDGHVILGDYQYRYFESGDSILHVVEKEFDFGLILEKYSDYHLATYDEGLSYGKIKDKDIGYIHFFDVEGPDASIIDDILQELKDHKAIIIDLRNNNGGNDEYAHRIAGAFADGKHFIYTVQTRNGPNHNDFDAPTKWYSKPEGSFQYTKPVILLTSKYTVSGAEILTLNMKSFAHLTHMGDTTRGDHSDQSSLRFLPNGWSYAYANQLYLLPDGQNLEGIGIAPDIYVRNSREDIEDGNDIMLERAIEYLFEEYGIE
ncbi:MAG: S41 family peptidase [Chitinophagales bacterium]|nr:S41 family peptidase [Chitinophagales bacterium]